MAKPSNVETVLTDRQTDSVHVRPVPSVHVRPVPGGGGGEAHSPPEPPSPQLWRVRKTRKTKQKKPRISLPWAYQGRVGSVLDPEMCEEIRPRTSTDPPWLAPRSARQW